MNDQSSNRQIVSPSRTGSQMFVIGVRKPSHGYQLRPDQAIQSILVFALRDNECTLENIIWAYINKEPCDRSSYKLTCELVFHHVDNGRHSVWPWCHDFLKYTQPVF